MIVKCVYSFINTTAIHYLLCKFSVIQISVKATNSFFIAFPVLLS